METTLLSMGKISVSSHPVQWLGDRNNMIRQTEQDKAVDKVKDCREPEKNKDVAHCIHSDGEQFLPSEADVWSKDDDATGQLGEEDPGPQGDQETPVEVPKDDEIVNVLHLKPNYLTNEESAEPSNIHDGRKSLAYLGGRK